MKLKIWIKNSESKNIFRHEGKFNEFKQTILRTTLDEWISMAEIFEVSGYYSAFPKQLLELINKICSDLFAHHFIGLADRCSIQLRKIKLKAEMFFSCGLDIPDSIAELPSLWMMANLVDFDMIGWKKSEEI